jgi:tetratricopeptide (TPR) repeat protein/tRNA A-37 threonylcarbamoyl transferase component Bud32
MGDEVVGQVIADGRFEIVEKLGEGAMGEVYRARQVAVGRMVALKLIHVDAIRSFETSARFQREMKLTAKIEHANTVRVYDFGAWKGQLYLAMELLRGKTLRDELAAAGRFPLDRIVHVARQITRALAAAHSEGIVHRDLKPENVMLLELYGERDTVKVLDFGIAKSFDDPDDVKMTGAGGIIGTPAYMSPEQAMGQRVDPRSDLYSLGIILFELASGKVPFDAPSLTAMLVAHATEPAPPLENWAPGVHPELAKLVAELLQKDANLRPQHAQQLDARLAALGQAHSAHAAQLGTARTMIGDTGILDGGTANSSVVQTGEPSPPSPEPAPGRSATPLLWIMLASLVLGAGAALSLWANKMGRGSGEHGGPPPIDPRGFPPADPADRAAEHEIDLQRLGASASHNLAVAGLPLPPEACTGDEGTASALLLLAAREALKSDAAVAIQLAGQAVDKCPSWAAALNIQGNALQAAERLDEASEAYSRALHEAPNYDAARFNLGVVQLRRKSPDAIRTFSELIALKPSYPDVYKSRAQAYLFAKQYREGLADLEKSLEEDRDDGTAWLMVGQLRSQLKLKGAEDAYCEAAARHVESAVEHCKRK